MLRNKASENRTRTGDRDLLTDDRTNRQLEAIDMGRHSQPRPHCDQRLERRRSGKDAVNGHGIGIEIEEPATALHSRRQITQIGELERSVDPARSRREYDVCGPMWQLQGAPVASSVDLLDARHGPGQQEAEHPGAIERLARREEHRDRGPL